MTRLFHYCCHHSARGITARGFLKPTGAIVWGFDAIWLTDQATPDRELLGLTSHTLDCDRLEFQYIVDVLPGDVERWTESPLRNALSFRAGLREFERDRRPDTWFVSQRPLYAVRNRDYIRP